MADPHLTCVARKTTAMHSRHLAIISVNHTTCHTACLTTASQQPSADVKLIQVGGGETKLIEP